MASDIDQGLGESGHTGRRTDQLTPFTTETARTAAQRSAEVRRTRKRLGRATSLDVRALLDDAVEAHERSKLGPTAAALAAELMGRLLAREIKLRGADVAPVLRALVDIARLESGEPTSAALVAHVDAATITSRVSELQRQARAALAVVVESDPDDGSDVGVSLAAKAARDTGLDVNQAGAVHAPKPDGQPEG
jgi:hypothetical protein